MVCDGSLENDDFSRQTAEGGSGDVDHLEVRLGFNLLCVIYFMYLEIIGLGFVGFI